VDQKLEHTASIVNVFVDLVDEEEKKQDILASWKLFEIEVRRSLFYIYGPDLILIPATTTIPRPRPVILRIGLCWDYIWSCPERQTLLSYTLIFTILAASLELCCFGRARDASDASRAPVSRHLNEHTTTKTGASKQMGNSKYDEKGTSHSTNS
jgi:hypothetical protein